jgi:hypothetical protein
MAVAAKDGIWLRRVLAEVECGMRSDSILRSDNQSAIAWAEGERFPLSRAKHVDVRVHFIRDLVKRGELEVPYVPTKDDDADILKKPVGPKILEDALHRIGILSMSHGIAVKEE